MRFAVWDHAGKAAHLHKTLLARGHKPAANLAEADLLLLDCDWRWAQPRPEFIQAASQAGARVALYPHGGLPTVFAYDGLTTPDPLVDLRLEHGPGSIAVAEAAQLGDLRQQAVGWLYSPTKPFKPVNHAERILFAPQHPNMATIAQRNGSDPGPALNQRVYKQLLRLGVPFTVSVVGPAYRNGVWPHPAATIIENPDMAFQHALALVAAADLVVAAGSMAALAIAQGKPTVMLGQGNHSDWVDGRYKQPTNTHLYDHLVRYPLDVGDGDLQDLFAQACQGTPETAQWRQQFVGDDGANRAVDLLELLVAGSASSRNVTIQGVTATGAGLGG